MCIYIMYIHTLHVPIVYIPLTNVHTTHLARQHSGSIQVSEGGGRCRVCKIIRRHVDGLYGGDRPLLGGGDSLLETPQIGGEGGLVPHSRWDSAEESGHFGVGLE